MRLDARCVYEVLRPDQLADTVMKSKRARGRKIRFDFHVGNSPSMCAGVGAGLNGQPASLMRDSCMGRSADVDALDLSPEAGPPRQQLSVEVGAAECFHMPFSISVLRGTGATLMRLFWRLLRTDSFRCRLKIYFVVENLFLKIFQ
jgi:hypothetical protein